MPNNVTEHVARNALENLIQAMRTSFQADDQDELAEYLDTFVDRHRAPLEQAIEMGLLSRRNRWGEPVPLYAMPIAVEAVEWVRFPSGIVLPRQAAITILARYKHGDDGKAPPWEFCVHRRPPRPRPSDANPEPQVYTPAPGEGWQDDPWTALNRWISNRVVQNDITTTEAMNRLGEQVGHAFAVLGEAALEALAWALKNSLLSIIQTYSDRNMDGIEPALRERVRGLKTALSRAQDELHTLDHKQIKRVAAKHYPYDLREQRQYTAGYLSAVTRCLEDIKRDRSSIAGVPAAWTLTLQLRRWDSMPPAEEAGYVAGMRLGRRILIGALTSWKALASSERLPTYTGVDHAQIEAA